MSYFLRKCNRKFCCVIKMIRNPFTCPHGLDNRSVRLISILAGIALLLIIFQTFFGANDYAVRSHIFCFRAKGEESFPDISTDPPATDRSIFFIDTACISHLKKKIFVPTRQLCVIESAARLHPNLNVYVLFGSPGVIKFDGRRTFDKSLQVLLQYDNIKLRHIDYDDYLLNTPLESFAREGIPYDSPNSPIQANHILRMVTLWKYGGIFLDLNILVLKNLEMLAKNSIGMSHENYGNDVLKISANFKGKKTLRTFMKFMKINYVPEVWDSLGSGAIDRALPPTCRPNSLNAKECGFLRIYPTYKFYPNDMRDWVDFFNEDDDHAMKIINGSFTMRNWNIHIAGNVTEKMVYGKLAKKFCPKVYEISKGEM